MNEITLNRIFRPHVNEMADTVNHLKSFFKNNNYFGITVAVLDWPIELGSMSVDNKLIVIKFSDDREYTMFVMRFSDRIFIQGSTTYLTWSQRNIVFGLSE